MSEPVAAGAEELGARLGGDHTVDREPSDREEEGQGGADVGAAEAEDAAGVDDLGLPGARPGVGQKAEDGGGRHGPDRGGGQAVPDAEAVIGGQQAGGEKAGVVDERARPEEGKLSRGSVPFSRRDRFDPVALDLSEGVAVGVWRENCRSCLIPPPALPGSGSCGRLWSSPLSPFRAPANNELDLRRSRLCSSGFAVWLRLTALWSCNSEPVESELEWRSSRTSCSPSSTTRTAASPHITVTDHTICGDKCEGKYCNHFCPAGVYVWDPDTAKTLVSLRELHRVRRMLDRLPVQQHRVRQPARRLRRPVQVRLALARSSPTE